ncbi:phospholipase-like protein [Artemisia annua]|uniref:Phospholipase-like protein n=1 Tax=Artemisia annua TaxID=35608 RepID=A0A2U1LXD4_ARTAN|nr:phospholipase-like protein [Artemisia annua]
MEHERAGGDKGKRATGKRKMEPESGKGKKIVDNGGIGNVKGDKAAATVDGQASDDDFVSQHKTKIPKVTVNNQKKDVISMGFGDFLEFKINDIPTRLGYWLLDRFDEETRILDVNGRRISITPDLVKNMLGVPMGDIHIEASDNADYRNPLIKQWKGQFRKDVKKFFNSHVVDAIVKNKRGGWMFKLNFLVLFFSTIGELNLSNTVNLRFLPCINNEDDIPKLDWCSYIIECLVRTKRAWNRNQHFNGPVILILVVYATLDTTIKHWSSDMLHKLEADMFQKVYVGDAAGDDRDVFEEVYDEEMEEDIGWEDDLFEDDASDGVPEDAEAMKKKAAAFLKRAGELIEMGDKVIDKGIEDNPDDHGFLELKELRDQLFVPRKFSDEPDVNEDEEAYEQCFTPEKGVNKKGSGAADECVFPFTQVAIAMSDELCREWSRNHQQIPTRLNFEDDEGFDLNVTQPPATQGKVVVDDLEADQVLLESLRDYVSQDPADVGGFTTPDHPILVGAHESNTSNRLSRFGRESMGSKSKEIVPVYPNPMPLNVLVPKVERARAQRKRLLPEVLRSPYMTREVSVVYGLDTHEKKVAQCFFSGRLQETDVVFKTPFVDGERVVLESLFPGIDVASGAIDLFTHVLKHAEKQRSKTTVMRLYCHTSMLTSDMVNWDYHRALQKFVENMDYVLNRSEYDTLDYVQLVFFPVIKGHHFFVVCMNIKDGVVQI